MKAAALAFSSGGWLAMAQRLGRLAQWPFVQGRQRSRSLPGPVPDGPQTRDLPAIPPQSFREWWAGREAGATRMSELSGARTDVLSAIRRAVPWRRWRSACRLRRDCPRLRARRST